MSLAAVDRLPKPKVRASRLGMSMAETLFELIQSRQAASCSGGAGGAVRISAVDRADRGP